MAFNPTKAIVNNEGCDLHYWYQGQGPLIVFVPGGNGHGRQYNPLITALSGEYTCATFDRRQMSASRVAAPKKLSPPQQARDIRAVIRALGFDKAIVFGSSSGGLFSLQFAHDFPEMVDHIVAHESPATNLLPDAAAIYDNMYHLREVYEAQGMEAAAAEFEPQLLGYDDEGVPRPMEPEPWNAQNFWANEFGPLMGYTPNFNRIRENGTSVGLMRGVRSRDAWYARSVDEQAKILQCPRFDVPGAHEGFQVECEEFLPHFHKMLETLEKRRRERERS
ncbi:putative hydrolase [Colletotrichum siamense]|uniref:Hydrolase n=1 Tax=Colletotrichum siamense TaxID=690259 RepID=A0A9P5ET09_COLSI|nr:putative hydrolase [Colletotrichum siamense]KAF4859066.1 putative hydrolase [Colletotrichum siamense]